MDASDLAELLCDRLAPQGTPERAAGERRYLRSDLTHLGVRLPLLRRTTRSFLAEHGLGPSERTALARALWDLPIHEARQAAVHVLERSSADLDSGDLPLIERMLRTAGTWALVDPLSHNVVGAIAAADAHAGATLDRWIADADFWLRRAVLLAPLRPIREDPAQPWPAGGGRPVFDVFAGYADRVLDEKEFFIRKAIGWVLREAGKRTPDRVVAWLEPRTARASGVTMREAVKYLPAADAERLMAAYHAGGRRTAVASATRPDAAAPA